MEHDPKFLAHYLGKVADNAHPQKRGWVRVTVPGLLEEPSEWAYPTGGASGTKNLGGYDVPPIGAEIHVAFMGGDPDVPFYYRAGRGLEEELSAGPDNPKDADKVKVYESNQFLVVLDGVNGTVLVSDKATGNKINMSSEKITLVAPNIELGAEGVSADPLTNGVVLASGVDPFTGATYGVLQSASNAVTAKKV